MTEDLKALQEKIKKLKLEKELKKLGGSSTTKHHKVHINKVTQSPAPNQIKVRQEIADLEKQRAEATAGKGFFGRVFAGAHYNKEISDRKAVLRTQNASAKMREQITLQKERLELEKTRGELAELNRKRVDFNKNNTIKFEDLMK